MPNARNRLRTCTRVFLSRMNRFLKNFATTCLEISSCVGPRPPVAITISFFCQADFIAARISFSLSPIVVTRETAIPTALSLSEINAALVLMTCPIRSSSPMDKISACILRYDALNSPRHNMRADIRIYSCYDIIEHYTCPSVAVFEYVRRINFHDVEKPKEKKCADDKERVADEP